MAKEKIGPWLAEDYDSFLALDTDLRPPPPSHVSLSGLMAGGLDQGGVGLGGFGLGGGPAVFTRLSDLVAPIPADEHQWTLRRLELIEQAWLVRQRHPIYKWLKKKREYLAAWSVWERAIKQRRSPTITSPTASFVFIREFVQYAGFAYMLRQEPKRKALGAHANRRRKAAKYARDLDALLNEGIRLNSYTDTSTLRSLLGRLISELSAISRKEYGGAREHERWLLKSFALSLITGCGLKSPHGGHALCPDGRVGLHSEDRATLLQRAVPKVADDASRSAPVGIYP